MAVVSPWHYPVFTQICVSYGHPPYQNSLKVCFYFGAKNSHEFFLNMGSRQVIMALMYWDTPVLQWNVQFVAINFL